jgi:N6-adenosine-specific RNA methylase IME4
VAKFNLIVADCPWSFGDTLQMSRIKRGASAQYNTLSDFDITNLNVESIAADDAVLALWVPSSKLQVGLDTMMSWGFEQTQTFIWVKTKKPGNIFKEIKKDIRDKIRTASSNAGFDLKNIFKIVRQELDGLDTFDLNQSLSFYMGRLFRQTHEIVLVGKRGSPYSNLKNKSQRSVLFDVNLKHSAKPEGLQERLELMFPESQKLELFARREREGWVCVGNQCASSLNEDIRDSIKRLKSIQSLLFTKAIPSPKGQAFFLPHHLNKDRSVFERRNFLQLIRLETTSPIRHRLSLHILRSATERTPKRPSLQ